MRIVNCFFILLIFICLRKNGTAQEIDSLLTLEQTIQLVLNNHPLAGKAQLLQTAADARMQQARGYFDPKAFAEWDEKTFDQKNYFRQRSTGLQWQSPLAAKVEAAYNYTDGVFLNPENSLPAQGQASLGVSLPLGRGLFIDPARAATQSARIGLDQADTQQALIINDLMMDVASQYVSWLAYWQEFQRIEQAVELTRERLQGTVQSYFEGDKPAIDTLETYILLQSQQVRSREALQNVRYAWQNLRNFLWIQEDRTIAEGRLPSPVQPEPTALPVQQEIDQLLNNMLDQHPALRDKRLKQDMLNVDERLAREQLKPQVDVKFNLLADGWDFNSPTKTEADPGLRELFNNNYKWGLKAGFPLFLRKERGKLSEINAKQSMVALEIRDKENELRNKLNNYAQQLQLLEEQIQITDQMIDNYRTLLQAEQIKFDMGESSVFLLNSRQQKLLEAELKRIKLEAYRNKNRYGLYWAAGQLRELFE